MPGNNGISRKKVVKQLASVPASNQFLKRADFDLSNGNPNQRSRIARYKAELPLALREDVPMRLMFVVQETFTTDGTAGNTETFNLANDLIESANTTDFVLYENANQVQPDSVSYTGDSFDYTDDATGNQLHAFYVARDPVQIEIEVAAPKSRGGVQKVVYDDATSLLHTQDQNKEPPQFDFDDPMEAVVPRKWTIDVYQDGPVGFDWDDSDATNSDGTEAINAILSIPIRRAQNDVEGLSAAAKQAIIAEGG